MQKEKLRNYFKKKKNKITEKFTILMSHLSTVKVEEITKCFLYKISNQPLTLYLSCRKRNDVLWENVT